MATNKSKRRIRPEVNISSKGDLWPAKIFEEVEDDLFTSKRKYQQNPKNLEKGYHIRAEKVRIGKINNIFS